MPLYTSLRCVRRWIKTVIIIIIIIIRLILKLILQQLTKKHWCGQKFCPLVYAALYISCICHASTYLLNYAGDSFCYFGFGSNLLAARIHVQNPTAVFHTTACLSDYRLDFDRRSFTWKGATATVVPSCGDSVWGVVWLIKFSELSNLDAQEGVHVNIYKVSTVSTVILKIRYDIWSWNKKLSWLISLLHIL